MTDTRERFSVNKLIVSQVRRGGDAKARKDRGQALTLLAALGELHPGAIESAIGDVPTRARRHLRSAVNQIRESLEHASPRAWEELTSRAGR
jgi:hypothetical protein